MIKSSQRSGGYTTITVDCKFFFRKDQRPLRTYTALFSTIHLHPLQYFSLAHQYSCGDLSCSAVDDYGKHWWPMSQNGGHRVECEYIQVSISTIGREELTSNFISPHCALNCLGKWYTDQRHNFKHPWWQSSSRHGDPRVVLGYKQ